VFPDQFFEFRRCQSVLYEIAKIQVVSAFYHKLARFAARRAFRLLQELNAFAGFSLCGCRAARGFTHSLFHVRRSFIGNVYVSGERSVRLLQQDELMPEAGVRAALLNEVPENKRECSMIETGLRERRRFPIAS
jgi:hypothetical protein